MLAEGDFFGTKIPLQFVPSEGLLVDGIVCLKNNCINRIIPGSSLAACERTINMTFRFK